MKAQAEQKKRVGIRVGEHRHHTRCRFCTDTALEAFVDFAYVPLAGGFHAKGSTPADFEQERKYPLQICVCKNCWLVQVNNAISASTLFEDYFYFSSAIGTLAKHFSTFAEELRAEFPEPGHVKLLELGCNDGVFLKPLRAAGFQTIGVDPAKNVVAPLVKEGFTIYNDCFTEASATRVVADHGKVDAIFSSNSFAHIDDMHDVMRGVDAALKPDGKLVFEVHSLSVLLGEMHYDMMYHEHMSYYSLLAIEKFMAQFNFEVFDVRRIPVHGGSIRFSVQRKGTGRREIAPSVAAMRAEESALALDRIETYRGFGDKVRQSREGLRAILEPLLREGKSIAGYGASGRATQLSAYCQLGSRELQYVIDDAPAKQGAFMPGNFLPIVNSSVLKTDARPDYVLLFAWAFAEEIRKRNPEYTERGGKFIAPLPVPRVL